MTNHRKFLNIGKFKHCLKSSNCKSLSNCLGLDNQMKCVFLAVFVTYQKPERSNSRNNFNTNNTYCNCSRLQRLPISIREWKGIFTKIGTIVLEFAVFRLDERCLITLCFIFESKTHESLLFRRLFYFIYFFSFE